MALSNNGNGIDAGVRSLVLALNSRLEALWAQGATVGAGRAMGGDSVTETLKAPFPYFGGKSRIAAAVWERFERHQ